MQYKLGAPERMFALYLPVQDCGMPCRGCCRSKLAASFYGFMQGNYATTALGTNIFSSRHCARGEPVQISHCH